MCCCVKTICGQAGGGACVDGGPSTEPVSKHSNSTNLPGTFYFIFSKTSPNKDYEISGTVRKLDLRSDELLEERRKEEDELLTYATLPMEERRKKERKKEDELFRPDITEMVDWALRTITYLPTDAPNDRYRCI